MYYQLRPLIYLRKSQVRVYRSETSKNHCLVPRGCHLEPVTNNRAFSSFTRPIDTIRKSRTSFNFHYFRFSHSELHRFFLVTQSTIFLFSPIQSECHPLSIRRTYARWGQLIKKLSPEQRAQIAARQAELSQKQQIPTEIQLITLGKSIDPFKVPLVKPPLLSKQGIRLFYERLKRKIKTPFAIYFKVNKALRKNQLPRFNRKEFLKQSAELYQRFHQYMCAGRFGEMSDFVAPAVLQEVQRDFGSKKISPLNIYVWTCKDLETKITNVIYIETPTPQSKPYVQVTVQFKSNQMLQIFSRQDKTFLGGHREPKEVIDTWVIERVLDKKDAPYFLVDRLK